MLTFLKYLLLIFLFCSCNKKDKIQTKPESSDSLNTSLKDSVRKDTTSKIFEGLYIYNLNINSFMDCSNPDSLYFVIDETKKLADMYKKTLTNPNVYGSVVAKLKGNITQTSDETKKEKISQHTSRNTDNFYGEKKLSKYLCPL